MINQGDVYIVKYVLSSDRQVFCAPSSSYFIKAYYLNLYNLIQRDFKFH